MATQTGITIAGPNEPYTIVDTIARPSPGPKEVLVKSLYVGINPVEPFMQHSGILIEGFPAVIGSDFTGVVLETGPECKKLTKGDYVFGCVPVGLNKFSPFQETFLAGEDWVFKKTEGMKLEEGPTVGSGLLTAGIALIDGQDLAIPVAGEAFDGKDSWVIVMGGSGTVGQAACQIARLCGYKVLASCSPSKAEIALKAGASATFSNKAPIEEQLDLIKTITDGGLFWHVFDASAQSFELSVKALDAVSRSETLKYFSTVDDWSDLKVPESIQMYRAQLGQLGRSDTPLARKITERIEYLVGAFQPYLESGDLSQLETYELVPGQGWEKVVESIAGFEAGKFSKKPVIKVQDE